MFRKVLRNALQVVLFNFICCRVLVLPFACPANIVLLMWLFAVVILFNGVSPVATCSCDTIHLFMNGGDHACVPAIRGTYFHDACLLFRKFCIIFIPIVCHLPFYWKKIFFCLHSPCKPRIKAFSLFCNTKHLRLISCRYVHISVLSITVVAKF